MQHLAEDETGEVETVETVADVADETAGTVTVETGAAALSLEEDAAALPADAEVKAEFEVDGFSNFVITWNVNQNLWRSANFHITVNYVDEYGDPLEGAQSDTIVLNDDNELVFAEYNQVTNSDGKTYRYVEARYATTDGRTVTKIRAEKEMGPAGIQVTDRKLVITFSDGTTEEIDSHYSYETVNTFDETIYLQFYLVFEDISEDAGQTAGKELNDGGFEIVDTVITDGNFTVQKTGSPDFSFEGYTFRWYRADATIEQGEVHPTDGWSTEITPQRGSSSYSNITNNGRSMNVAVDADIAGVNNSHRLWYQVEVVNPDGVTVARLFKRVPYYVELQNGSFETPYRQTVGGQDVYLGTNNEGVIWSTTDKENRIEIIKPGSGTVDGYGVSAAADGGQIAELNATSQGTLYQDILTVPGATLNWQLSHRARTAASFDGWLWDDQRYYSGYDTMYVVIMSSELADQLNNEATEEETYQDKINDIVSAAGFEPEEYYKPNIDHEISDVYTFGDDSAYPGVSVWRISDKSYAEEQTTQWDDYQSQYTVPDDQFMTRFLFVAGPTAYDSQGNWSTSSRAYSVGNFLDNIQFTSDPLDPVAGVAAVQINKTITGLSELPEEGYTVSFDIENTTEGIDQTVQISNWDYSETNKNWTGSVTAYINLGTGDIAGGTTVTVTESAPDVSGYELTPTAGSTEDATAIDVALVDGSTATANFTNAYTRRTADLTITKDVDDTLAAHIASQQFNFTVTGPASLAEANIKDGNGTTVDFEAAVGGGSATATVTVTGEGSVTITDLPMNETYTVAEVTTNIPDIDIAPDTAGKDYYWTGVSYSDGNGGTSGTVTLNGNTTITATNTYAPYKSLIVTKSIDGEMASSTEPFGFTITKTAQSGATASLAVEDVVGNENVTNITGVATSNTITFDMKANGQVTIYNLKDSDIIAIQEEAVESQGYRVTVSAPIDNTTNSVMQGFEVDSASRKATVTVETVALADGSTNLGTVNFLNYRAPVAPTGLESNHTTPYVLMITAAGMAGLALIGGIVTRRIRRRRQE